MKDCLFDKLDSRLELLISVIDSDWDKLRPAIIQNMRIVLQDFKKTTLEFEELYSKKLGVKQN